MGWCSSQHQDELLDGPSHSTRLLGRKPTPTLTVCCSCASHDTSPTELVMSWEADVVSSLCSKLTSLLLLCRLGWGIHPAPVIKVEEAKSIKVLFSSIPSPKLSSTFITIDLGWPLGVSSSKRLSVGRMSTNSAISMGLITSVMQGEKSWSLLRDSCVTKTLKPASCSWATAAGSSPDSIRAQAHPISEEPMLVRSIVDWAVMSTGYPPFATPSIRASASSWAAVTPPGVETSAVTTFVGVELTKLSGEEMIF